jgi:hypothetical protein
MRKLILILLALIAVFTYIRAFENDPRIADVEIVSGVSN